MSRNFQGVLQGGMVKRAWKTQITLPVTLAFTTAME